MKATPLFVLTILFFSCSETPTPQSFTPEEISVESQKASALFDHLYEMEVDLSPQQQAFLGRKTNMNLWDDISEAGMAKGHKQTLLAQQLLRDSIQFDKLNHQTKVSYRLYEKRVEDQLKEYEFRHYNYPVNQMFGTHSEIPSFLINLHKMDNYEDALAYLERMEGISTLIDQLIEQLKIRESKNVIPPKFVFGHIIRDCENISSGSPVNKKASQKNTIYVDFESKIKNLEGLESGAEKSLLLGCEKRLMTHVVPAYRRLSDYLKGLEAKATEDDGVWKFENGEAFYAHKLGKYTNTDYSAEQIHQIGLDEVKRIHGEMLKIIETVGFKGDLQAFFEFMRTDPQFYYPNTKEGKAAYIEKATGMIDSMRMKLDILFKTKPKAEMVVKSVEAYREKSAGKAFYEAPAPDGSRPGIYYANTYRMEDMPIYQMESLAYHEGIPGHHMQLSIAQEMGDLPMFRRYGGYTAYIEGWALYTEFVPKEYGFYSDPYSDFGRLAAELWRACRLVVDSGIHSKKWTREQGIAFYKENTPNPEGDCIKMVERHVVMPGQATAYKIGMMKILDLRAKAKKDLADKFDIRDFHDVVLTNGSVPLDVLEELVDEYIATTQTKS